MSAARYAWMASALCAQADPDLWTDGLPGTATTTARRICAGCPVIAECDQHRAALEAHDGHRLRGVWGGRTQRQRRQTAA
ncbi:WhiB family transcriptional regulator [Streptomyces tuirus]|uniref:WhiB family transcriptional regulator n=1 Tax=Streptomyces tuirus TaxID=68278 RepID=A0A941F8K8_9ACTN|nr:WhiB family transcriptional regulator [Streptomyces tuirus]